MARDARRPRFLLPPTTRRAATRLAPLREALGGEPGEASPSCLSPTSSVPQHQGLSKRRRGGRSPEPGFPAVGPDGSPPREPPVSAQSLPLVRSPKIPRPAAQQLAPPWTTDTGLRPGCVRPPLEEGGGARQRRTPRAPSWGACCLLRKRGSCWCRPHRYARSPGFSCSPALVPGLASPWGKWPASAAPRAQALIARKECPGMRSPCIPAPVSSQESSTAFSRSRRHRRYSKSC